MGFLKRNAMVFVGLLAVLMASQAYGFVVFTNGTNIFKLPTGDTSPSFQATGYNNYLSADDIFVAITSGLSRWEYAGSSVVSFSYSQNSSAPQEFAMDGINAIFFTSNSPDSLGANVLGATESYFTSATNNIVEFDVELNDNDFIFTMNPSDTSANGTGTVFVENVLTHELGHAYGLNHSGSMQATMQWLEHNGQAYLSCDDIEAIGTLYPATGYSSARGTITGTVTAAAGSLLSTGTPIVGAHVQAISMTRLTPVEGQVTDQNGNFTLSSLEPDNYYIQVEPFMEEDLQHSLCQAVPPNSPSNECLWENANALTMCSGSTPFLRTFLEAGPGVAQPVTVTAGGSVNLNDSTPVTVGCTALSNTGTSWASGNSSTGTAPTILSAVSTGSYGVVAAATGSTGANQYYHINTNGVANIVAGTVGFGLYSPLATQVTIVNAGATQVTGSSTTFPAFYDSTTKYGNYDSFASLASAPAGDYYIQVTDMGNPDQNVDSGILYYPSYDTGLVDTVPYYLLIVTLNNSNTLLPSTASPLMANNLRCKSADSFPAYPGAPGSTSSGGGGGSATATGSVKACSSITNDDGGNSNGGPPSAAAMVFSIWGLAFIMGFGRLLQQLARRLVAR